MTLALGLLAHGGAVIAADREQGHGTLKADQGKISAAWIRDRGHLAISGAGNGPYLDSFAASFMEWFKNDATQFESAKFQEEFETKNYEFYQKFVLPFSPYEEAVDYELIACFYPAASAEEIAFAAKIGATPGRHPALWTSHKLTVLKEEPFAAVGFGATTAKALLSKFWVPLLPLEVAVNLAAYVAYQVKQTVKDVGLETDILLIRQTTLPTYVDRDEIAAMEAKFTDYRRTERENLYYCLGGDLAEHEEFLWKPGEHKRREKSVRKFFEQLNAKRLSQWGLKKRPRAKLPIPEKSERGR